MSSSPIPFSPIPFHLTGPSPLGPTDLSSPVSTVLDEAVQAAAQPVLQKKKKSISWEAFPDTQLAFKRQGYEQWHMFSTCCPHFPDIGSEEEAEELLEKLSKSPSVSSFIPKDTSSTAAEKLTFVYEKIKLSEMSDVLIWLCCLYLIKLIRKSEPLYEEATVLLEDLYKEVVEPQKDKLNDYDVFWDTYQGSADQNELKAFVRALISLIPLEELAELRLDAHLIEIANANKLTEVPFKWKLVAYVPYKEQMASFKESLKGKAPKDLDLSTVVSLEVLPQEVLAWAPHVKKLDLGDNYCNISDSVLSKFSSVAYLSVAFDELSDDLVYRFLGSIGWLPNLVEIDLSSSSFAEYDVDESTEVGEFVRHCQEREIDLVFPWTY